MNREKPIYWLGRSLDNLKTFPDKAKRHFGFQLSHIQHGEKPIDYKPMPSIGKGIIELRTKTETGAYRVVYVAKFNSHIYVLHAFQKKTKKTSKADVTAIKRQYKMLVEELE